VSCEDETRIVCFIHFGLESHSLRDLVTGTTVPALLRSTYISQLVYSYWKWRGFTVVITTGRLLFCLFKEKAREGVMF